MVHGLGVRSIHSDSHTNIIVTNAKLQARTRTGKACTTVILMPEWGRSAHTYAATKLTSAADGSDLGRSSTDATNVTYAVAIATSTWSSKRGKRDPGATPHRCLIQMNCNIGSFEAPQNSMTRVTGKGYFRGRARNQYSVNTVSSVSRNHSAISFNWKGRSSSSRSGLSNSVISPAVLGFLIGFNARKAWLLRGRLESGIFFIAGSTVSKN
jgi:hypothetical protein